MKKKILVLGGNGFIGRNLAGYALANGLLNEYSFVFVGRNSIHDSIDGITYKLADLADFEVLKELLLSLKPDYIINLAGIIDAADLDLCIRLNAELPRKLIEIILENGLPVENILLVGSAAEYGDNVAVPLVETAELRPLNSYGLSKVIQTEFFKFYASRIRLNMARTFNIVGPYISNRLSIGSFIEKINGCNEGDTIYTGNLSSSRDYLHVDDVIDAFLKILFNGRSGEIYNVCSGNPISMEEILDSLIMASGKTIHVEIKEDLVRKGDVPVSFGNHQKLTDHTGWSQRIAIKDTFPGLIG